MPIVNSPILDMRRVVIVYNDSHELTKVNVASFLQGGICS